MTEILAVSGWAAAIAMTAAVVMLADQVRWLRAQLTERQDHRQRLERVETGLSEHKVDPPEADVPPAGVQIRLDEAIGAWDNGATQAQKWEDVRNWRREGREWDWIVQQLEDDLA